MFMQEVIETLNRFWLQQGCLLWQPYHTEVGAGTSNPATFLRALGPEPWWVAYPEPSTRPADGRYGENPNRLQHYYQYQVILKPSPPNVQELFLQSLEALGLDLREHDFRFVEDNWQSPSLGAWGLGWEAWIDGMEVLQFTYFQECGGMKLDVRACELTYGIERIAMYLQGVESVYDLKWAPSGITYGDIFHTQEVEYCRYNFEVADTAQLLHVFETWEEEGKRLLEKGLVLPAYDHGLRMSHLFNLLDARGALSVTERGRFLLRCREIAETCAKAYFEQRNELGFPLRQYGRPCVIDDGTPIEIADDVLSERETLLLEIGVEELPPRDVRAVLDQTPELLDKLLGQWGLGHGSVSVWATPRRIAIEIAQMPAKQPDVIKEVRGPNKKAALNDQGEWTVAARKFAEAHGASPDDIYFEQQGKHEYCFIKAEVSGKHVSDLLTEVVAGLLKGLQFGKTMGWEDTTVVFSRPVRWLLALHGTTPIPVSWKLRDEDPLGPERMLQSGAVSYGHRRLASGPVTISSASEYKDALRKVGVLVDRVERMEALRHGVEEACAAIGLNPEQDEELLDEICDLVEWPEPILCTIPEEALELPEPIIITPMKVHQRYIPLRDNEGNLSRHFLAVANGNHMETGRETIRVGNQRVLNARLRDAKYFWDTDTQTSLRVFADRLSSVLFHQKLGTMADKVTRIRDLYFTLREPLPNVDDRAMADVISLMKADLTTQMVFEFDSLEGIVGMLYAQKEGMDNHVAQALFEHRLPRRPGDDLPSGQLGIVAGILDRLDTLAGYFGIGVRLKGTSDPYGLRRNALALLAVIEASELNLDLETCFRAAIANYGEVILNPDKTLQDLLAFVADRMAVMARERGYAYDIVAAALDTHRRRPAQFATCLKALVVLDEVELQNLAEQTKRMERIAKEPADAVREDLLSDEDRTLYSLCGEPATMVRRLVQDHAFSDALAEVLRWLPAINAYFENVLVNDKDEAVRRNRHALLQVVLDAIVSVADVTRIEKREVDRN